MSPQSHNRRVDDMSAEEVKEFWHGFCERKGVDDAGLRTLLVNNPARAFVFA